MAPPFRPGQFVWCQFPYSEAPLRPGPKERVGYVADIRQIEGKAHITVMSIYTTTAPWRPGTPLPLGIIPVEPATARRMNQKGFVMDCRRIAFIPVTPAFFPRLDDPDKGIVHTASVSFQRLVLDVLLQVARRTEGVVKLGPDVPGPGKGKSA